MPAKNKANDISCWIITEGIAGTENQCIGVAQALGIDAEIKRIALKQPWKTLSPYLGFENCTTFSPPLLAPWPDLLIAAGRKSIAASRYIKKMSNGKTFTLQIQDPRISAKHFDLVAVPEHDPLRGDNVIVTKATPNKITTTLIEAAKHEFPKLETLKMPRVAVLIGGNSKAYAMNQENTQRICNQLKQLDASLMITCSRRTGEENLKIFKRELDTADNFFWDGKGKNPYFAMLGRADFILVTADSASMISESCTTGKPVYMLELDGGAPRIQMLHNNLIKHGALRIFEGNLSHYNYEPLNDAQIIANAVKKHFKGFTQKHQ